MVQEWDEQLIRARYHLSVAKRLFENFSNYEVKRFLSGSLNEMALCGTFFVNSFLIYLNVKRGIRIPREAQKRIKVFSKEAKKMFSEELSENILIVFDIKKAQKKSPIEFLRKDKVILIDKGEYKAITIKRLNELIVNLEKIIKEFSKIN